MSADQSTGIPPGAEDINRLFCIADWLANSNRKKAPSASRAIQILAFLMGPMSILYIVKGSQHCMVVFPLFFLVSAGVQIRAERHGRHRKFLDEHWRWVSACSFTGR